jgi:hypothetical protein
MVAMATLGGVSHEGLNRERYRQRVAGWWVLLTNYGVLVRSGGDAVQSLMRSSRGIRPILQPTRHNHHRRSMDIHTGENLGPAARDTADKALRA